MAPQRDAGVTPARPTLECCFLVSRGDVAKLFERADAAIDQVAALVGLAIAIDSFRFAFGGMTGSTPRFSRSSDIREVNPRVTETQGAGVVGAPRIH